MNLEKQYKMFLNYPSAGSYTADYHRTNNIKTNKKVVE